MGEARLSPDGRLVAYSTLGYAGFQEPAPDGERLLVGVFEGVSSEPRVFVTLNWFEELRRRVVPSGR